MSALISELLLYIVKFILFLACAFVGIKVGGKIRANKNAKLAAESKE